MRLLLCGALLCAACSKDRTTAPPKRVAMDAPLAAADAPLAAVDAEPAPGVRFDGTTVSRKANPFFGDALVVTTTATVASLWTGPAQLIAKGTCKVAGEDELLTSARELDVGIWVPVRPGSSVEGTVKLFAPEGLLTKPRACELNYYLERGLDQPEHLDTQCWSGGEVAAGPCADLTRVAGDAAFEVTRLERLPAPNAGWVDVTILVGADPAMMTPTLTSRCEARGTEKSQTTTATQTTRYLVPGESVHVIGGPGSAVGVTWCELTVAMHPPTGDDLVIATRCLRDDRITDGAC